MGWLGWLSFALGVWIAASGLVAVAAGRFFRAAAADEDGRSHEPQHEVHEAYQPQ